MGASKLLLLHDYLADHRRVLHAKVVKNVPSFVNAKLNDFFGASDLESNTLSAVPSPDVTVWNAESELVHVIFMPGRTFSGLGENALSFMFTAFLTISVLASLPHWA